MNASARFFVQSRTLVQARGAGLNRAAVKRAALPLLYVAYCAGTAYTRLRLASGSVTRTRALTPPPR